MRLPEDRLNGWKEIAAHLGKGVRTVQRWEHQYGLPVHRLGVDAEVVFAFRSEIDDWAERRQAGPEPGTADPPGDLTVAPSGQGAVGGTHQSTPTSAESQRATPPSVTGRPVARLVQRPVMLLGVGAAIVLAVAAWTLLSTRDAGAGGSGRPASSWEQRGDTLRVLDDRRGLLWQHRYEGALDAFSGEQTPADQQRVRIADLDGDGRSEVLVNPPFLDRSRSRVELYDETGRLLFTRRPSDTVHFGDDPIAPPWLPYRIWITDGPAQTRSVWVAFIHGSWYPTLLEEYAPDGRVRNRYWSNGYISSVEVATWRDRPVVFVGAASNETGGGSLAILPREWGTASSPAATAKYRCGDCPPDRPLEFLVFPPSCVIAALQGNADVWSVNVDALSRLVVSVHQLPLKLPPHLQVKYTLAPDLREADMQATPEFVVEHDRRWRSGEVDHQFSAHDAARMLPVRRWTASGFVPIAVHRD